MFTNVMLAWAVPVDPLTLLAQVEAYASTKASLTVLGCCIKHASAGTSIGDVPPEVAESIAEYVRHNAFKEHQEQWQHDLDCFYGSCQPSVHIDSTLYSRLRHDYIKRYENWDRNAYMPDDIRRDYEQGFTEEGFEIHLSLKSLYGPYGTHHKNTVKGVNAALNHEDGTQFTKALKVLKKNFGLAVHFTTFFSSTGKHLWAYLILPSKNVYGTTAFRSMQSPMVVDSSVKKELSAKQVLSFKRAIKVLSLTPHAESAQLEYSFPREVYRSRPRRGQSWLKTPTKKALRMAFREEEVDIDEVVEWPQFVALAYGLNWSIEGSRRSNAAT